MYYVGTIEGASGARNNFQTGVSGAPAFFVPTGCKEVYLQATGLSGLMFQLGGQSFLASPTMAAFMPAPPAIVGPLKTGGRQINVVSIYNPIGGGYAVKVFVTT